jgi:hypothetical protein
MSLSNKLSIADVDLKGKRVLIRVSNVHGNLLQFELTDGRRSTSTSHLIPTRRLRTTSASSALSQRSNTPRSMAPKL